MNTVSGPDRNVDCVELRQMSVQREGKTITAAVYEYRVDNDGAWGEIQFDLVEKTAWVERFAEKDLCDTWEITDCAIDFLLECDCGKLPKKTMLPVLPGMYSENNKANESEGAK